MRTNISIALNGDRGMAAEFGWGDHEKGIILSVSTLHFHSVASFTKVAWFPKILKGKKGVIIRPSKHDQCILYTLPTRLPFFES